MGCRTKNVMEKRDGAFVFEKKDLKINLDDGARYVVIRDLNYLAGLSSQE